MKSLAVKLAAIVVATVLGSSNTFATAILYGVTGDGANTSETLFTLSTTDASATFFMTLGNGSDGESIGYNSNTAFMNHGSGISDGDRFWEEIDLDSASLHSSQQQSGSAALDDELLDLAFNVVTGFMMATDRGDNLYSFTSNGVGTLIGDTGLNLKGLAYNNGVLFGAENRGDTLYTIDDTTGVATALINMTLDGSEVVQVNGLTTNPDDGSLWGILRHDDSNARFLATIDTTTGIATSVGQLSDNFAGIEFVGSTVPVSVPVPATLLLFGLGLAGLGWSRKKA